MIVHLHLLSLRHKSILPDRAACLLIADLIQLFEFMLHLLNTFLFGILLLSNKICVEFFDQTDRFGKIMVVRL